MKKILLNTSILALSLTLSAQSLQRQVVSAMGDVQTNGNVTLSYTVGQPIAGVIGESNKLSQGFQQNTVAYQDIDLRDGWGAVSTRVKPYDSELNVVYADVMDNLTLVKNNEGNVFMPEINFNNIGDWEFKEGYKYFMENSEVLTIRGSRVIPELNSVNLNQGWNMFSYLRINNSDVVISLDEIADDIVIVKDQNGGVYLPEYSYNAIGNFNSGQGYQIKTTNQASLTFASNTEELRLEQNNYAIKANDTKRFSRPVNTGSNHTVMILETAWEETPQVGDELAAYDKEGNMVGSIVLQDGHNAIAVWGDDEITEEKEGLAIGEPFSLVLYKSDSDEMITLKISDYDRGSNAYIKDGLTVISGFEQVEVITQEMELFQNVPNPVRSNTDIGFFLPEDTRASITLINNLGQEFLILDKAYTGGYHSVSLDRKDLQAGMYFYSLKTPVKTLTKQLTIVE